MKSVYGGYVRLETEETAYFAGANTASGFRGLYGDIADERVLDRVYIIKGGPGTGKSTLIRKTAGAAAKEGIAVECYLCGSDPYSLDCAVLDGRIAVLDGTAPHVRDMTCPGAASALVDVSNYWDSGLLEERRWEITQLCEEKSACWESAYRYLRAAASVNEERTELAERIFDREKAEAYIGRFLKRLGRPAPSETGRTTVRYTRAVTMRGMFYLPAFERQAETLFAVADAHGCAVPFMDLLAGRLTAAGFDAVVSFLPVTGHADGIYLPRHGIAVVTANPPEEHRRINMTRFVRDDIPDGLRGQMRLAAKIEDSCMDEAAACLVRASGRHFALEEIYKQAMDFRALGRYTGKVCAEIAERLKK